MYCAIRIMLHCDMGTFVVIYAKVHPCFSNSQAFFCLQRSLGAAGRPTASSHWLPQCPLLGHCLNHSSRPLAGFVSMSHIRAVPVPVPRVWFHTVPVSPVSEDTVPVSPMSDGTPPPPPLLARWWYSCPGRRWSRLTTGTAPPPVCACTPASSTFSSRWRSSRKYDRSVNTWTVMRGGTGSG